MFSIFKPVSRQANAPREALRRAANFLIKFHPDFTLNFELKKLKDISKVKSKISALYIIFLSKEQAILINVRHSPIFQNSNSHLIYGKNYMK